MPKRPPHGRPAKHRNRPRRPPPSPRSGGVSTPVLDQPEAPEVPAEIAVSRALTPTAPAAPAAVRRATARRTPALALNYSYLRRDVRTLGVLAPGMVIVLVLAYFFFH